MDETVIILKSVYVNERNFTCEILYSSEMETLLVGVQVIYAAMLANQIRAIQINLVDENPRTPKLDRIRALLMTKIACRYLSKKTMVASSLT